METLDGQELIYDWNALGEAPPRPSKVLITDETLRDGLQSPSVTHPSVQDKVYLLYLMRDLGIDAADLGLCGAGERFKSDVTVLAREIATQGMPIQPQSAARTLESDISPIVEASEEAGEVREPSRASDMQLVLRVPLDSVAQDDVVRVEVAAVVELHAVAQRAGPDGELGVGRALGRERRDHARATDFVRVQRLVDLLAGSE